MTVFLVSGFMLAKDLFQTRQQQETFDELGKRFAVNTEISDESDKSGENQEEVDMSLPLKERIPPQKWKEQWEQLAEERFSVYRSMKAENSDMIGWIRIEGTNIDYPVMQSPDRPDYYLHHDFYKKKSSYGTPYLSEMCRYEDPRTSLLISGHHMKNGSMFASLQNYTEKEYFLEHPYVQFDTTCQAGSYEVAAVIKLSASGDQTMWQKLLFPQVKGESFLPTERIKVYILEVKDMTKGPRILVSRTHPELVKRLFESEVTEVKDGTVEIKSIAREAGSRTKMAVYSNDPNVDPVGACVGLNGARVNAVVEELRGEKIDIINWSDNSAILIENALSPAKVICVVADDDEKTAQVIVPDYQLSLAIGKEGQNARLAARLTGFKIDIKSETQARESGLLEEIGYEEGLEGEYESYEDYEEGYLEEDYAEGYVEDGYEEGYPEGGYPEADDPEDGYADGGEGGEIPGGV